MNLTEYFQVKKENAEFKFRLIKIAAQLHENDQYSNDDAISDLLNVIAKLEEFDVTISDSNIEG